MIFSSILYPNLGPNGGDALGIWVPLKNTNEATWKQLKPILKILRTKFHCDVYDLYGGQKLNYFNINKTTVKLQGAVILIDGLLHLMDTIELLSLLVGLNK